MSEWSLLLTADESEQLMEELGEVIERYRAAGRTSGPDADRETYSVFQLIQPYPDLPTPASPDSPVPSDGA